MEELILQDDNLEQEIPPIKINIYVAPDKMTAYLRVLDFQEGQELTINDIMEELEKNSITYGIQNEEIGRYCYQRNFRQELKVAVGLRPIKGEDGRLIFGFETVKDNKPKERPDGSVDFRELNLIENVVKDQLLCTVIPPQPGTAGINVHGIEVEGKPGAVVKISNGANTYLSEDNLQVFAATDGGGIYKRGVVEVEEIHLVRGDVGVTTGNINFNGSVSIEGNVPEGFEIIAQKDIEVKGMVEGASLVAGGNILINGGVNGMRKAVIRAEGNVTTKFVQNATIICGGDINSDVIVNGYIKCGQSLILKGEKASLIGGEYLAGKKIQVRNIGTPNNLSVSVSLLPNWYEIEKAEGQDERQNKALGKGEFHGTKEELENEIAQMEEVANRLRTEIENLSKVDKSDDETGTKAALMRKFMAGKMELAGKIGDLKKKLAQMKELEKEQDCKIICTGTVNSNVKISIGYAMLKVDRPILGQHFYASKGDIQMGPVLPNELD